MTKKSKIESKIFQVLDACPLLFSYVDKNEKYVFVNKLAEHVFGMKKEEIEGKHVSEIIGQEMYLKNKPNYARVFSGESLNIELNLKDHLSQILQMEVKYIPVWEGESVEGMFVIAYDTTEHWARKKDQELFESLNLIYSQDLNENEMTKEVLCLLKERLACDAVWLGQVNTEDALVDMTYENQKGIPLIGLRVNLKDYGEQLSESYIRGETVVVEDVALDPMTRTNLASFEPLKISSFLTIPLKRSGVLKAIISVAKDRPYKWSKQEVTLTRSVSETLWSYIENHRLMNELREAVKARDEFISVCSHELKTPISSLKLIYQMSEKELKNKEPKVFSEEVIRKRVQISNLQIERMSKLIDDMLDVSRISTSHLKLEPSMVDLGGLVEVVLHTFQEHLRELHIQVSVNAPEPVILFADAFRLEQVITNLLSNAIKYGNGHPIHIKVSKNHNTAFLKVTDSGIGIEKHNLERIFHRYERVIDTKEIRGLGLGLYISSRIVETHHGSINVESELGKGSTFTVALPLK